MASVALPRESVDGPVAANPIFAVANPAWLYVPRAHILVPSGSAAQSFYYLNEDGLGRFITEDGASLFIQE